MNSHIFRQLYYDFRHQPVAGTVTMIGTALTIFLIMIMVMTQEVKTMPFAPESNRDRMLFGRYLHLSGMNSNMDASAGMAHHVAKALFGDLESAETTTFYYSEWVTDVSLPDQPSIEYNVIDVDDQFFRVFDFDFIAGKEFDRASYDSRLKEVIITEKVAREMFGSTDVVGQDLYVTQIPYRIVGVVKDVSRLADNAFAEVYKLLNPENCNGYGEGVDRFFGGVDAAILMRSSSDVDAVKAEVAARKAVFSKEIAKEELKYNDHGAPFNVEELQSLNGSNGDSYADQNRRTRLVTYAILLLVPAINLSSMTQGRLRRRISEIGVRRAFGCTRRRVITDILLENFILTLIGGLIGLILSSIFGYFFSNMVFSDGWHEIDNVAFGLLVNFRTFGYALLLCFILNLLSAGIPAWKASRVNPVDAINTKI